jgi:DNA-binding transcriptional MerR regulator
MPGTSQNCRPGNYPAYTMGRAAAMLGTTQGFLRALGDARLITPLRSEGGHRRYSRYQLRIAARARELVDHGTPIEAACRIVILEVSTRPSRFTRGRAACGSHPDGMHAASCHRNCPLTTIPAEIPAALTEAMT